MKGHVIRRFGILVFFILSSFVAGAQTLIMNEVSNGPAGNQEYVEFVVVSDTVTYNCGNTIPPCVDIRGWIFDDNSGYHGSSGVASGAVRFSQNSMWACVPVGTIILIYNNLDRNVAIPADDLSMTDGNCRIIAPINNTTLFESNATTPGAVACSYPPSGWTPGGNWNNTLLANAGDCARIVNLAGCEVFSVCWGSDNLNNLIYISGSASQKVYYFNGGNPQLQSNWSSGTASPSPGLQTPGAPNNAANASYIAQFNNNCTPITPIHTTTGSVVNAGCSCTGSATASSSGSIGGYTYTWYDASYNPIGQTTATATGLCGGVYHVIGRSSIGCTDTASVTVGSTSAASVTVTSATVCQGQAATVTATPTTGGGTYSWAPGGQTTASITVSPTTTTTYTVSYTVGACTNTAVSTVTVTPPPTITVNSPTICAGQIAIMTASGATSYSWSTGATGNMITATPASTTSYTVTGTTGGCSSTAVSTVTVNPVPTVTVTSASICPGATASLTASGATSYTWSAGATSTGTNTADASPATTTSYTVTGTANGCSTTAVSTVTVLTPPTVTVNSPTICAGQTANLAASGATSYTWSAGATSTGINTADATPASTTSYTVTGTASGCTATAVSTVTVTPLPTVTVNSPTTCSGQIAVLTASGASSYSWDTGATTNPLSVTPTTTTSYTVTGTANGCSSTAVSTVTVNPVPTVTVTSASICPGATASLTASGATSYTWSAGATSTGTNTADASPASTTTYTVTGTTTGCSATAVSTVTVLTPPTVTVNSPTICAGQTANLTASGATSYTWSAGATSTGVSTADASPTTTTSYTVTGTTSGCTGTAVSTVTVNPLPVITVNAPTICNGQTATLTAAGATSYSWNTGATANPLSVSPATTTTYTVTGTTSGCSSSTTTTVTVNAIPTITTTGATVCPGGTANISASGATSYVWSTGDTTAAIIVNPSVPTTYTVTGTQGGCSASATAAVTFFTVTPANAGADDTICSGGSTGLAASPAGAGFSYAWLPATGLDNAAISNPTASPASTTNYAVTVTDANGCTSSDNVTVVVDTPVTLTMSTTPALCNGSSNGQATVTASGGSGTYGYLWSTAATTSTINAGAGTYYVGVTDSWGCSSADSATITEPAVLTASATSTNVTCHSACNGTATASATGGTAAYSYSWNSTPSQATAAATGLCPGTYTCTITDVHSCSATAVVTITEPTAIVIDSMPDMRICSSATVTLNVIANGGSGAYTYNWAPSAGLSSTTVSNPSANPSTTTTYTVQIMDGNGCTASRTVTVNVNPPLGIVMQNNASVCPGGTAGLSVTASSGTGAGYTYSWSPATGLDNASIQSPHATPAATTTYTVTVTDLCGASVTGMQTVTILPLPVPTIASDQQTGCVPLCVAFADTAGIAPGSITAWNWNFGDGNTDANQNPQHCYTTAGNYAVSLAVTGSNGCSNTITQNNYINAYASPHAAFANTPAQTDIFTPEFHFINESTDAATWLWNLGDMTQTTALNPSHIYANAGAYMVWLYTASLHGCTDSVSHTVVVEDAFTFYAPNAFTPNENGLNDVFLPKGSGWDPSTFDLMIFDRWGNLCFESKDMNKGWNGQVKGGSEVAQMDVYIWKVTLMSVNGEKHSYKGTVTVVK